MKTLAMLAVVGWCAVAHAETGRHQDRLTLPAGRGVVAAVVAVNLSPGPGLETEYRPEPKVSPELWYGVSERVTVGVVHSARATTGLLSSHGTRLCVHGYEGRCRSIDPGAGVVTRVGLARGGMAAAMEGGMLVRDVAAAALTAKAGLVVRWHRRGFAIEGGAAVFVAVNERAMERDGATAHVTASASGARFAMALQVGAVVPFVAADDHMTVPLSIGARYALGARWSIDGAFSLAAISGGENMERGDEPRVLSVGGSRIF